MAKSPEAMTASMIANLKEKTGRDMDFWVAICKGSKLTKHGELVQYLKTEHRITHGYANLIVHTALNSAAAAMPEEDLVEAQYSGAKAGLRSLYEALLALVKQFGTDVEVAPKKAYVSLRRGKQFAIVQPSTATRLDVGINLKGTPATPRLEASGSFNSMVSHRVRLASVDDVDDELARWLRAAYEAA